MALKSKDRGDKRKITKFNDRCTGNTCIICIVAIFKDKMPSYIAKNTPKKWISNLEDVLDYVDTEIQDEIKKECSKSKKIFALFCDYQFNWVDDPKDFIEDQIKGQNISTWLHSNGKNNSLVYATSWNKID